VQHGNAKVLSQQYDRVLVEVLARELARMADEAGEPLGPLGMSAALLRTLDPGGSEARPAPDRRIDAAVLSDYLIGRGVIGAGSTVSLKRSALGYSKDTYLIAVETPGARASVIVIRRDLPAGPSRTTVVDEFPLVSALFARGFPIAEPVLLEADPGVLGRPFMIGRGAAGAPDLTSWEADPGRRALCAAELAAFLGRLHATPVDGLAVRRSGSADAPDRELAAYFREWRGYWRECGPAGLPAIERAFDLMEAHLPTAPPLVLVHSDVGFHNILVEDGRVRAVLDWEFSHLGEPEEDLAYCRPTVETLMPWSDFLERYRQAGGAPVREDRLRAYQIWRGLRNAACCALGLKAFHDGLNTDLRLAFAGRVLLRDFAADVETQMQALSPTAETNRRSKAS